MTSYAYDSAGNLAAVTNALGVATVYQYDLKGNRTYEGGGTYPVTYAYDAFNSVTNMTTYRDESLQSGDVTTWLYDEATGLVTNKVYADGYGPAYTYTPNGNLASRTWARGVVTSYLYDGWNSLTNTSYSDGTPAVSLSYDAMGRQVSATDVAGTTVTAYDAYGAVSSESTAGLYSKTISRTRDVYGRDLGYTVDNSRKSIIEYEADTGRMKRVMFAGAWFTYYYLPGTDLKSRLQYGGSGSAYYTYEPNRDLLTQVQNYINGGVVSQYDYVNDALGRRTVITRSGSMMSETRTDYYGYNDRGELVSGTKDTATTNLTEYAYTYDDIGNRLSSLDLGTNRTYTANALSQYTNIVEGAGGFLPQFDDDGNQTLIKTATGVWQVSYNCENRPVLWECGSTNITMKFDRMGRRVEYVEMVNGVTNAHHRFVYDGYVCIQRLNGAVNNAIDLVFGWDPTEPVATRPLILQKYGQYNLFYTHDGNKNVSELVFFQQANGIAAHYEYAPFGAVTATSRSTPVTAYDFRKYNPFAFSAEYADNIVGLFYYNYRHYNPQCGRWLNYDRFMPNTRYVFVRNDCIGQIDVLGLVSPTDLSQKRECTYLLYAAHGVSDPDGNLWDALRSRNCPTSPNGDRYGYWGCGANVFNEMTHDGNPGCALPVVLPRNRNVDQSNLDDLIERGIPRKYAEKYETFGGPVNPTLTETIEGLKAFAKASGDMDCCCSSISIKVECSDAVRNAEVFYLLSDDEQDELIMEASDNNSAFKKAYERYNNKYKDKIKCGTTIRVE